MCCSGRSLAKFSAVNCQSANAPLDADEKDVTVPVDASPEEITRRALAVVAYW